MLNFFLTNLLFRNLVVHILSVDLTRLYNVGFLLGIFYIFQVITGALLVLSFNYLHDITGVFLSVFENLDAEQLFFVRSGHVVGTSVVFFMLYVHLFKVYSNEFITHLSPAVLYTGVTVFLVSIGIAFFGYVLPLSQMSYWGLVVFSNIISTFPVFGKIICFWLWGGEYITSATLIKVLSLHVILPFITLGIAVLHLTLLHVNASSEGFFDRGALPYESTFFMDAAGFRDGSMILYVFYVYFLLMCLNWSFVYHEESWEIYNSMKTSAKIIPEWFLLLYFGILKAVPSKIGGLGYMIFALLSSYFLFTYMTHEGGYALKLCKFQSNGVWVGVLGTVSIIASFVSLLFPMIELLVMFNLFYVMFTFFKVL